MDQFVNPQDAAAYDASNEATFLDPWRLPTRALIALDIKNIFNSISRKRCREILVARFPGLVPFFDLLYSAKNKCHYRQADGKAKAREQEEGFAQGCPLSGAFAALVLHNILCELNQKLRARAAGCRQQGHSENDDGFGGVTHILANINDTSAVVPLENVEFFCDWFVKLGAPLGEKLAPGKTIIMTACNGVGPLDFVDKDMRKSVRQAINTCCREPGELEGHEELWGTHLLGFPVSWKQFAKKFL